ncbi:hypothetical protein ACKLNR_007596 [Fusarium oxysporum f. sp. zingiberi]
MLSTQETKTNLIADAKDIEQDLINMSASAATIQACYILVAMSRGTHEIKQHCLTSGCNNIQLDLRLETRRIEFMLTRYNLTETTREVRSRKLKEMMAASSKGTGKEPPRE